MNQNEKYLYYTLYNKDIYNEDFHKKTQLNLTEKHLNVNKMSSSHEPIYDARYYRTYGEKNINFNEEVQKMINEENINNELEIKMHLNNKFELLFKEINHPILQFLIGEKSYFAGGCIRSLLENKPINDYDMYFTDADSANKFKELLDVHFSGKDNKLFGKNLFLLAKTDNAITCGLNNHKFQFITKYTGDPDEVIKNFDWTNSMGYFIPKSTYHVYDELYIYPRMVYSIKYKQLAYNEKCWNPLNSAKRMVKFVSQGYELSDIELNKLLKSVQNCSPEQSDNFFKKKQSY